MANKTEALKPSAQYKAALYALRCGDRSFAERYAQNQPRRARSVLEHVTVLAKLGWLSPVGMEQLGFKNEQLTFTGENGKQSEESLDSRLDFVKERLARSGASGLGIGTVVTEIGKYENTDKRRDLSWRRPVMAELNEYADLGHVISVGDRLYHPNYAPSGRW